MFGRWRLGCKGLLGKIQKCNLYFRKTTFLYFYGWVGELCSMLFGWDSFKISMLRVSGWVGMLLAIFTSKCKEF
jgi:hypothetical protein